MTPIGNALQLLAQKQTPFEAAREAAELSKAKIVNDALLGLATDAHLRMRVKTTEGAATVLIGAIDELTAMLEVADDCRVGDLLGMLDKMMAACDAARAAAETLIAERT